MNTKKVLLVTVAIVAALTAKSQDCRSVVLAHFNYDTARMDMRPQWKIDYLCAYAHAAFYVSDTVPYGADLFGIEEVAHNVTGAHLPATYEANLETLNYFAYNFKSFQLRYPHGNQVICFRTPSSEHPYLVLRSIEQMQALANQASQPSAQ